MKKSYGNISWIQDVMRGSATVGGQPIRERVAPMVEKGERITRLGRELATESVGLLRDLVQERPMLVFGVMSATALLLARFASARALGTAATVGLQAARMARGDANP
jgi:hypothetical protein